MADFRSIFAAKSLRRRVLPFGPRVPVRIAQISAPHFLFEHARAFAPVRGSGLEEFEPQCLVGSARHLDALSKAVLQGELQLKHLRYPVFLLTESREMPASDSLRHQLWESFGVPVFEILLSVDYLPVAYECEAREGWHLAAGTSVERSAIGELWYRPGKSNPVSMGLLGTIADGCCACGLDTPRIVDLRMEFRDPLRELLPLSA